MNKSFNATERRYGEYIASAALDMILGLPVAEYDLAAAREAAAYMKSYVGSEDEHMDYLAEQEFWRGSNGASIDIPDPYPDLPF